jgi:Fe-S-cluster containining protein
VGQRVSATLARRKQTGFQPTIPFIPCPLLVDDRCSIYKVRPLVCQAWYSTDVRRCQEAEGGSTTNREIMQLFSAVYDGLVAAVADHGLESGEVELIPALKIALNNPDATQRWLAGESLFSAAAAPPPAISIIN